MLFHSGNGFEIAKFPAPDCRHTRTNQFPRGAFCGLNVLGVLKQTESAMVAVLEPRIESNLRTSFGSVHAATERINSETSIVSIPIHSCRTMWTGIHGAWFHYSKCHCTLLKTGRNTLMLFVVEIDNRTSSQIEHTSIRKNCERAFGYLRFASRE